MCFEGYIIQKIEMTIQLTMKLKIILRIVGKIKMCDRRLFSIFFFNPNKYQINIKTRKQTQKVRHDTNYIIYS